MLNPLRFVRKERTKWEKHWQCDSELHSMEDKPKALKVKLDLLEVENQGAQVSSGSVSIKGLRLGTEVL